MLYLDTSSLLKYLLPEPDDEATEAALHREDEVAVSALTLLEAFVQIRAKRLGGMVSARIHREICAALDGLDRHAPFVFRPLSGGVFSTALHQHRRADRVHCRSLDRLHLAAMEELGIARLMTHDARQSAVAQSMGFEVLSP